jgi:hypothetical protein
MGTRGREPGHTIGATTHPGTNVGRALGRTRLFCLRYYPCDLIRSVSNQCAVPLKHNIADGRQHRSAPQQFPDLYSSAGFEHGIADQEGSGIV